MNEETPKATHSGGFRVLPCIQLTCQNCANRVTAYIPKGVNTEALITCRVCQKHVSVADQEKDHPKTPVYVFEQKLKLAKSNCNRSCPGEELPGVGSNDSETFAEEASVKSEVSVKTSKCDVCGKVFELVVGDYCRACLQKLCQQCSKVHENLAATVEHHTEPCWSHVITFSAAQIGEFLGANCESVVSASYLEAETGLQVCFRPEEDEIDVLAPLEEINDLVIAHLKGLDMPLQEEDVTLRVGGGRVQWLFAGYRAKIVRTLFNDEIEKLVESYPDVSISYTDDWEETSLQNESAPLSNNPIFVADGENSTDQLMVDGSAKSVERKDEPEVTKCSVLKISSRFDLFPIVHAFTGDINCRIDCMNKAEVVRARKDEFRVMIYAMVKENDPNVVCTQEKNETAVKLIIRGRDANCVEETKQEFLSLFCKECSECHAESFRPMFLDCKHVLCHTCVVKATCHNDGMKCHACSDAERRGTPVPSLQVQCVDFMDEIYASNRQSKPKNAVQKATQKAPRKKTGHGRRQLSTKVPKYLLQKWSRRTGGLTRLRSLIENNYGLHTGGPDDNMKIYGHQYELLDLAIQSIEKLNEKSPEHGVTCRIADKMVEWRFRGDHSRLAYFLFGKELKDLTNKFKSVKIKSFTDFHPPVVDINCSFEEYTEVKYEIDELVNAMMFLHEDEYIQPKSFYYNIKVREFLRSKRTDENVFCDLREKNNRNVIIIKARRKEYINMTKDELANW